MSGRNPAVEAVSRLATLEPDVARQELSRLVLQMVQEFLGRDPSDPVAPRDRFVALGFDSLRATDFRVWLEKRLLVELRPTLVYDHPTPEALSAHLAERVLDLPPKAQASVEADDGLAEEMERVSGLSEAELRVLLARTTHRLRRFERERAEPIAIVGMACRFPAGMNSAEALWKLLDEGVSAVHEVPESRWPLQKLYRPGAAVPGKLNTRRAAMIEDVDLFDARFFNISPKEAIELDPQQRLLLEVSWEALEHANIPASDLYGAPVGVFIGIRAPEYWDSQSSGAAEESTAYRATGNALSTASGRISYTFGFKGPCFPVDTACSSSLVAVHLAVQSLRRGECTVALAGGANMLIDPLLSVALTNANMLAPDGNCKTFDAAADGYVRGEGCAMFVLKPLSRAMADGDRVCAVIRGTAINQDGASGGLTVPSGPAQEGVIRAALDDAGIQPWEVAYVEAHGTGTAVGDPIEIAAIERVFGGPERFHGQPLYVGAGKTNHGHMECAAGAAGLMKVALALQHERIPKNLNFQTGNPRIDWKNSVVKLPLEPIEWRRGRHRRVAGVSSYGFSGTNAHAIIEEAPRRRRVRRRAQREGGELVLLTARSDSDLSRMAEQYADRLEKAGHELVDVGYTAAIGRQHHSFRAALVAEDLPSLVTQLRTLAEGKAPPNAARGVASTTEPAIAFVFTGQGSQRAGMGADLYRSEPVFRETLDRCAAVLDSRLGVPLVELLWGQHTERINDTRYTQPAMAAYQIALASLWASWGIQPRWVLGHSVGEFAAAQTVGALSLEQALLLAEARGRLMDGLQERGSMAAVAAAPEQVEALIARSGEAVNIAAYNGPQSVVISGKTHGVQALSEQLKSQGVRVVPLTVSHAFHSMLMEPMLEDFRAVAAELGGARPLREWISTLNPGVPPVPSADYWVRHVREPVRFAAGMRALADAGCRVFLEIGPSNTLLGMGRACVETEGVSWIASQHPEGHGRSRALLALGQLTVAGAAPRWRQVFAPGPQPQKVDLPTYPFQRRRYWLQRTSAPSFRGQGEETSHPLLGAELPLPPLAGGESVHQSHLAEKSPGWLADHRVGEAAIFPGAGYLELGFALGAAKAGGRALRDLVISTAMPLDERGRELMTVLQGSGDNRRARVESRVPGGAWTSHASWSYADEPPGETAAIDHEANLARCPEEIEVAAFYATIGDYGLHYGEAFQRIQRIRVGDREILVEAQLPASLFDARLKLHPVMLDAFFQSLGLLVPDRGELMLPAGVERATLLRSPTGEQLWCRATLATETDDGVTVDLSVYELVGGLVLEIKGLRLADTAAFRDARGSAGLIYSTTWESVDEPRPPDDGTSREDAGTWLVLADGTKVADELVWLLDEQGARVSSVRRDQLDPRDPAALDELLAELDAPCTELVYLWPLDEARAAEPWSEAVHRRVLGDLLGVVQALGRARATPRVTVVTRGAQAVRADEPVSASQTPVWGFMSALMQEQPAARCLRIDLAATPEAREAAWLFQQLWRDDPERRLALREGRRYVARLAAGLGASGGLVVPEGKGYELRTSGYGTFQNLGLRPLEPHPPGPGEVQVRPEAVALNFKDVLHAMGVLREFSALQGIHEAKDQPLGIECAGRVVAIGEGVRDLAIGDTVMAMHDGTLASHITLPTTFVSRVPEGWSSVDAAGLQIAYFTAALGLLKLARIKPGERVLIHAAAGGVGQAALQICRWIGAEVYATASQPKWEHLQRQGVRHVMNSRTLDYADELLQLTGGVHVVLNSLSGEHIERSLKALAPGGRFIEIGKVGIWEPERVAAARPDVAYHPFDLGDIVRRRPGAYQEILDLLAPGFASGALRPLPAASHPLADSVHAFQQLASGKAIGKVVITMPSRSSQSAQVSGDRSYVISGGLGALGLKAAKWLARKGAGAIVLLGRSEPTASASRAIESIQAKGSTVHVLRVDIADQAALAAALDGLATKLPPVGGIVHAAGVLSDGLVEGLDWERFWRAMAPKVLGGWNLHRWSADKKLDLFVNYASIASVIGSAGQTAYSSANAFLEAMALERRRLGLPATSIHWGAWAGGGMASVQPRMMRERMRRLGMKELRPGEALDALDAVLKAGSPSAVIANVHWPSYVKSGQQDPFLSKVGGEQSDAERKDGESFRASVLAAAPAERRELLLGFTRRHLAAAVGMSDPNEITPEMSFAELGVDSLLALDLRTQLQRGLQLTLSTSMVFDYPTLAGLVTHLDSLLPRAEQGLRP